MGIFTRIFRNTRVDADYHAHVNADGTQGGLVAIGAEIDPSANVEKYSVVQPGAKVAAGERVRAGDFVLPGGLTVRFD